METIPNRWPRWVGGVSLLVVCFLPPVLLGVAAPSTALTWTAGAWTLDYGGLLSALPGLASALLLAPLVSYRRRDALMLLIPGWNFYFAWLVGVRVAELASHGASVTNGPEPHLSAPAQRA